MNISKINLHRLSKPRIYNAEGSRVDPSGSKWKGAIKIVQDIVKPLRKRRAASIGGGRLTNFLEY